MSRPPNLTPLQLMLRRYRMKIELQLFLASSASPPEVEPAVQKLIKARRQIMAANSTLKTVQERVDRMHHQIEKQQKK